MVVGDVWLSNRRQLLQQIGYPADWQQSDSDLVAHLWEHQRERTVGWLVGMFAIVVWDRHQQILWLARDPTGARTLYYTIGSSTRWIAPQLSSLTHHRSTDLDLVALRDYLCCAFVPGDRTLWQQVRELRPGHWLHLPDDQMQVYWQVREQIADDVEPLAHYSNRLRSLLETVVQEYLPPAAPVGAFLSGGLDSSCITALATRFHDAPVHTYSIHFGADYPNELAFSTLVAEHCQTQHHILEIPLTDLWERLPETMAHLDDPIGDPLTVPNLLLGQMASASVQIVLNGEGGDPCFGGPKNQPMLLSSLYSAVAHDNPLPAFLAAFQKCASDLPQLLKANVWRSVQAQPSVFADDLTANASYLNRLMALNLKFKGADQILTKVNNLTQAAGLQGRSPLFDARVVELSMTIPPAYKLAGAQEKAVLKQAVADLLPAAIVYRPKSGMMVPVQFGFRQIWRRQAEALLLNHRAAIAPYLNQAVIKQWLNYRGDTWNRYGTKLWLLVSLEVWLQVNQTR